MTAQPAAPARLAAVPGPWETAVDTVVSAEGVEFRYGEFTAVRDFDITVRRGELVALLGTNGAGKTTALDVLQGFRRPSAGRVRVHGVDPVSGAATVRRRTGAVLQQAGFVPELTVTETLRMCAAVSSRRDDVAACLQRVELDHRASVPVSALSGGERRRLDLATATWGGPDLVIMDEPTTGLDPASRRTLWALVRSLREAGTSVLLTTHYLEEVEELADQVVIMDEGRVAVSGSVDDVLRTRPARITAEIDATAPEPSQLPGLEVTRPAGGGPARLRMECHDLPGRVHELTGWAQEHAVTLHRLRATSAGLEDVFHAVLDGRYAQDRPQGEETR